MDSSVKTDTELAATDELDDAQFPVVHGNKAAGDNESDPENGVDSTSTFTSSTSSYATSI